MKKRIFISWCPFSRRIASMDEFFGYDVRYIPPPFPQKWLKPLGYVFQALRTAGALVTVRPDEVWLQCPPTFLPHLALALRPFAGRYRIVADCHHGTFEKPWTSVPGTVRAINACDLVLVHNAESLPVAKALGIEPSRIVVLEDPPPGRLGGRMAEGAEPYVLVPCSFSPDEPIPMLIAAARLIPEIPVLITGSRRKAEGFGFTEDAPPNVRFTDYLALDEFERLLAGAAVVMGLTSEEGIQLSVANEALGADRALVLSDTRILRAMFGEAALFAQNTPEAWAERLREGMARRVELQARSAALKTRRQEDWRGPAETVAARLGQRTAA